MKVHYSLSGEWGGEKTLCNKYYTANSDTSFKKNKVTCKHCVKLLKPKARKK